MTWREQTMTETTIASENNGRSITLPETPQSFEEAVLAGLSESPKRISSKWLYDKRGNTLFRLITRQPEYSIPGCEMEALLQNRDRIAKHLGIQPFNMVELGAGSDGEKAGILLEEFTLSGLDFTFVPIDISPGAIETLAGEVKSRFPSLEVVPITAEFSQGLREVQARLSGRRNLVLFLGSSIGNYNFAEARVFFRELLETLNNGDLILVGFDLKGGTKKLEHIVAAYNDAMGFTADFNLNLLHRMIRELGAVIDVSQFRHYEPYNPLTGAMESCLISLTPQTIWVSGQSFDFEAWEPIRVEYSYKYLLSDVESLAADSGFQIVDNFFDGKRWFVDSLWRVVK